MSTGTAQIERYNGMVEAANRMLAEVATAQDAVHLRNLAEAARVLAKQVKLGEAAVNHATAIKLRAEVRLADIIDEGQAAGDIATAATGGARYGRGHTEPGPKFGPGSAAPTTLADLGVDKRRLAESRQIRDHYGDQGIQAGLSHTTATPLSELVIGFRKPL